MELTITLRREEVIQAVRDFLPLQLFIGKLEDKADPVWIRVDELESVTWLAGRGLAVTGTARVHYPLPILPDDFNVSHLALEMIPSVVTGPDGARLVFALELGELDVAMLPDFIDRGVAKRINAALRLHAGSIAWDFTKTLRRVVHLPKRFALVRALQLEPKQCTVVVGADGIVLQLSIATQFHHEGEATKPRAP